MKTKCIQCLVIAALVFACMAGAKAEPEPVTIQMWDWFVVQKAFYQNELKLFQEKYPYIQVKRTVQTSLRYRDLINFSQRSGTLPDVFAIPKEVRFDWIKNGYFYPLNKWITQEFINRFPKGAFVNGINMYDGNYYSFPFDGPEYWCQFYINSNLFKKAGLVDWKGEPLIPKTWAEVKKYAKVITEKGAKSKDKYYGFGFAYRPEHLHANMFYEWARVAGGRGGNQDMQLDVDLKIGRYNFTDPGFIEMFKLLKEMQKDKSIYPNSLSIDDETLRANFADGKIAMIMGGRWCPIGWQATHPNFKEFECVMIPPFDNKGYKAFADGEIASAMFGIGANTKHPEESWKLMEWFARPETGVRYVQSGTGMSIFKSANTRANAKNKALGQYMEISAEYAKAHPIPLARNPELAYVVPKPVVPNHIGVFWGIMSGVIAEKDIERELKALEDRLNNALDEAFEEAIKKGYKVSKEDLKFPDWNPLENYEHK